MKIFKILLNFSQTMNVSSHHIANPLSNASIHQNLNTEQKQLNTVHKFTEYADQSHVS